MSEGEELINRLYVEMAEFSFLTKYIFGTGIEELELIIMDMSIKLSKIIPMDRYKKNRLSATLKAAGISMKA